MRNSILSEKSDFYTVAELAKVLGISRVSVLKRIWRENIKATKFGQNFIIFKKDIDIKKLKLEIKI
jgi:excisionase family DNA binding protein